MKILFGSLGVIYLIFLWLTLDFQLGRKKHLKSIIQPSVQKRHSQINIYTDGTLLFEDFFKDMRKAKNHIHILFYIAKRDQFSQEFFEILIQKAKEGVEVRLMLDFLGSYTVSRKLIRQLKEAGGEFAYSQVPKLPFLFYTSQIRNHRKIAVMDGVTGYIGGFNIGKEYINKDKKLNPWRDYHLKINGEGVLDIQKEFLTNWKKYAKIDLLHNIIYFPEQKPGPVEHEIIPSEAFKLERTFLKLISSAKETIMIGTPYFIPSKEIYNALQDALRRGVKIKIIVPKINDHVLVQEASYPYLRKLLSMGAQVNQYLNGFYHAKTLVIDDRMCDIGTANFDKRSFFLNYEINCFMYDKKLVQEAKQTIEKDFLDSKVLTLEELNKPNLWRSTKEKVATLLSYFL